MKITYIKMVGFKRFALRHSDVFECNFVGKLVMITGPNGAGKSSLFAELTPLPAEKTNYHKGGSKVIHITKDSKDYVLTSSFVDSPHYSFMCDGEELNPAGIASAQRTLAAVHFDITPAIHDLMTGGEYFTDMSLPGRKKLFNSITHMNIDHVLESYESLKEELKNNEYLAKTLQMRLLTEQQKLIDTTKHQMLQDKLVVMQSHIQNLLSIRTELHQYRSGEDLADATQSYKQACNALKAHYSAHLTRLTAYPLEICHDVSIGLKKDIENEQLHLRKLYTRMEHLMHEKTSLAFAQQNSRQATEQEVRSLKASYNNIVSELKMFTHGTKYINEISAELNLLERSLPELLETLPANPDRKLSKTAYASLLEEKNHILTIMNERLQEHSALSAQLKQLREHDKQTCPACNHTWLPSEVKGLLESTTTRLDELNKERLLHQSKIESLTKQLDEQSHYLGMMQQISALYSTTKVHLAPLWSIVTTESILYHKPQAILPLVARGIGEVMDIQKLTQISERLKTLQEHLNLLDTASKSSIQENTHAIQTVEAYIQQSMETIEYKKETLKDVETSERLHRHLQALKQRTLQAASTLKTAQLKTTIESVFTEIDSELSIAKVSVIEMQNELSQHSAIEQSVKTLTEQLQDAQENVKVLTCLTEELSPKNGFIAKTISHFLNVIIASVNHVIAGVWDYKMVLKAIDVESDSLNYRFKLEVEDRLTVDDVSKASAGMKEMINLAMKVTLFKLLKMYNYPMYLDEFGVKLDSTHRSRVADVIFKMLASPNYSQIFLITHLDLAYADFKDTQVVEL